MQTAAAVPAKDWLDALASALSRLTHASSSESLSLVPQLLVEELDAERAELWLREKSGVVALAHAAGTQASDPGARPMIERAAESRRPLENVVLPGSGTLSCLPLAAGLGALAVYTSHEAAAGTRRGWCAFAEIATLVVRQRSDAEENRKTIEQLSLLFEATRLLNSTLDLAELLELILKIARTECDADRGTVFLVDHKQRELWSIVATGLEREEIRLPFGVGVAGRVAETGETVNTSDAYRLPYFESSFDERFHYHTRSLLCLPIRHRTGEIVGVIQLLNRKTGESFAADDEEFLSKLSAHMAMALENARLHQELMEKQRLERDLALARGIQRSLLPQEPPVVPGYDIGATHEMCYQVGGDYFDFLSLGPQTLLLVIADVEGKGVSSALVMSNLQATLRALVMHLHSLEVLAMSLNDMICNDERSAKYLSIFLGLVDTRGNKLHYINAGHVPPLLIRSESELSNPLETGGTVVGLFPNAEYVRGTEKLKKGDILVCCTDGILEASDQQEEEFGVERLAAAVARQRSKPAQAIVESVLQEVKQFSAGGTHVDDQVLMVVKVTADSVLTATSSGKLRAMQQP